MPEKNAKKKPAISGMHSRTIGLVMGERGVPATLDEENRSVEVVCSTEQPCMVVDWDRWEVVPEILLMSGCQMPASRQVPLLDSHNRWDTSDVIGSCRDLRIEGAQLLGRAHYSTAPEAEGPYLKMKEGHLTDYSIGYRYDKKDAVWVPEGETAIVEGRTFTGPVKVVRKWQVKELSACPIGADDMAKARAATAPEIPHMGEENREMNEQLKKFLVSRGLSPEATEEEALRFLQDLVARGDASGEQPDVAGLVADAIRSEHERFTEIDGMCARAGITGDDRAALIKPGITVDAARKVVLEKTLAATPQAGFRGTVEVGADSRDKFRSAAEGALLLRSGRKVEEDQIKIGARELAGFSLRELARESLRVAGQPTGGDPLVMVGRALTTSDFPAILAATANKSLFEGYETNEETWPEWCATGTATDFKPHTINRASETSDLDEIKEDDEYKYGTMSDAKETYQIATYGKLFAISRQTIINDDLGALTDIPFKHGEAASRKCGDIVYAVFTANAAMGDGTALFHANHGNLGTAGVVSETTIAEAIKLMKLQKDIGGKRRLNIRPQFFIAPVSIEGAAEIFFTSNLFTGASADSTRSNPYAGNRFTRVYEPRLDDSSATAWYIAGAKGKTVKIFFLNGNMAPYLETKQGWNVDGIEFKVRHDCAAKAVDWKSLVKNAGQ